MMDKGKLKGLFEAFEKAPLDSFMEIIFEGLSEEQRKELVVEDVAFHWKSAEIVSLDVWMCLAPVESNRWIWAVVELNNVSGEICEHFFTKDSYRQQALGSLAECLAYYDNGAD